MTPQQQSSANFLAQSGPPPSQNSGGDLFEKALPTIGSLLPQAIGAFLAPETGGLSLLASLGLGAAGSAAGKAAENAMTGQNVDSGLLGAGVQGGVGQGIGAVAGKALDLGSGLLGKVGSAADTATAAASDAGKTQNLIHEFGQAMPGANEQTARGLGSAVTQAENLGVDTANPGTAQAMQDLSDKANNWYQGVKSEALRQAGPVNMTGMTDTLKQAVEQNVGSVGGKNAPGTSVFQDLLNGYQKGVVGPDGALNEANVDPAKASAYVSSLGRQVGDAKDALDKQTFRSMTGVEDPDLRNNLNLARSVYSAAKGVVFNRPEVDAAVSGNLNPEGIPFTAKEVADRITGAGEENPTDSQLHARELGFNENHPLAQDLADKTNAATKMQDILDEDSQFIRMNQLAKDAVDTNREAVATTGAKAAATTASKNAEDTSAGHAKLATAMFAGPHAAIPAVLSRFGVRGLLGTGAKTGKVLLGAGATKAASDILSQLAAHGADFASPTNENAGGTMQPQAVGAPAGGPMLANGTPQTGQDILSQLDAMMAADPLLASSLAPVVAQLNPQAQAATAASQALSQYQNTLGAAGGSQGPLGGILARLGGLITGGPANQVAPQQAALQALMAKAGAPGVQIPGLYANPAGGQAGLSSAQSILGALGGQ